MTDQIEQRLQEIEERHEATRQQAHNRRLTIAEDVPALCKALREARLFCPRCNLKQFDADIARILSGEEGE